MPLIGVDILLSAACTAKSIFDWICDHLENLKEADKIVKRILEFTEYMKNELKKAEAAYTEDRDVTESVKESADAYINGFVAHLENAKLRLEASELERNKTGVMKSAKKFLQGRTTVTDLKAIEDDLRLAMDKLLLFISVITLKVTCEARDSAVHNTQLLNEICDKIQTALQENDVGLEYIPDSAVKRPSAPSELTIREGENDFILSWKPCGDEIDKYELCYHESKDKKCFIDKTESSVKIGAPKVKPSPGNLVYTMKIRAVHGNIHGEWSNTVVGQFTKPLPQKPTIKKLFLRSTIAEITVETPAAICATESPVTCWQVAYIIDTGTEWSYEEFKKTDDENDQTFFIHILKPERKYTFKVKAMNAEGWSDYSYEISGSTIKLPSKAAKPSPPLIETLSRTTVKITVESPEGASFITPVILWQVTAIYFDCSARREIIFKKIFTPNYAQECSSFNLEDLVPKQQYSFKVMAKNEQGWSQPSDTVIAFTGPPLPPTIRPSSLKSTSFIKVRWEHSSKYTRPSYYEISKEYKAKQVEVRHKIPGNKSSITFTNLNHNTTYCFKLCSWNGVYVSEWSEEIEIKTDRLPMRKRLSPRPRSPLPPKAAASITSGHDNTLAVIEAALTAKAAELSDQSDDEDPLILVAN